MAAMKSLRVLNGLHRGGLILLADGEHAVGSDEANCEVVLFDEGIAPMHCVIGFGGTREAHVHVHEGSAVQLDGAGLCAGLHRFELPAHLCLGPGIELLVSPVRAQDVELRTEARRSGARPVLRWVASTACLVAFTVFVSGAFGWFDKGEPHDLLQARRIVATLGHESSLAVSHDVEGVLTVTGYVRSEQEAQQLRTAFRDFGQPVAVRVAIGGTATQFGASTDHQDDPRRLGAGSVLLEGIRSASAGAAIAGGDAGRPLELRLKSVQAGVDGVLETVSGARYFVGSQMPGGYTLTEITSDAITVMREGVATTIKLQN